MNQNQSMPQQLSNDPMATPIGGSSTGDMTLNAAEGGRVPAMVSKGEQYLPPSEAKKVVKGEKSPLKAGERIPGKPKYPGNDYRNDVVPKTLKEGGIVIPNEIMQSKDAEKKAQAFVAAHFKAGALRKGK
jgi:hypothetical protein